MKNINLFIYLFIITLLGCAQSLKTHHETDSKNEKELTVVVKKEIWDKISPESQKKIKEIGKFHFDRLTQSNIEADRKAIELLKQQGITIVHFEEPEEVLEEMGKMARESVVGKVYSRELLDKTLSILEEYRKNHPTKTFVRIK